MALLRFCGLAEICQRDPAAGPPLGCAILAQHSVSANLDFAMIGTI
ncbi:hypothetical protein [Phaeobacter sp. 11ANDIMAR09]|nr:hypothetical protein [Phaeobacter sp. 11ANDIMAR09]